MTPSLKKYRVTKVVLQHVSDSKLVRIKKVFVEVSAIIIIIIIMVVVSSFV